MQMSRKRKRGPSEGPSGSNVNSHQPKSESPPKKKKTQTVPRRKQPVTGLIVKPPVTKPKPRHHKNKPNKKKNIARRALKENLEVRKEEKTVSQDQTKSTETDLVKASECVDVKPEEKSVKIGKSKRRKPKQKNKKGPKSGVEKSDENSFTGKKVLKSKKRKVMAEGTKSESQGIVLPKDAGEISSNWKQFQTSLQKDKKKKGKKVLGSKLSKMKAKPPSSETISEPEIWFDDVDDTLIQTLKKSEERKMRTSHLQNKGPEEVSKARQKNPLVKADTYQGMTKCVAMDCEMVGVGDGKDSIIARVSIVNHYGSPVYDKFVKPRETVTDYRTYVSGIRPEHLENAEEFDIVQREVADLLKGRTLVGHALHNDLKVLYLSHPRRDTRDTSSFKPFRHLAGGRTPSLKKLTENLLGVQVQTGEHSSVEDAQAAMRLYTMHRKEWERHIRENKGKKGTKKPPLPKITAETEATVTH